MTQNIRFVEQRFPGMRCRAISTHFMEDGAVTLFELMLQDDEIRVVVGHHYKLAPHSDLDPAVEHVFADQKSQMGLFVLSVGIARAAMRIGLADIVYNMRRFLLLERTNAAA